MLTLSFRRRIMFQYDNVRGVPFTWNYVEIRCHCKVRLTSWLSVMIHACQQVTQCYCSHFNMSLVTTMQAVVIRPFMWCRFPVFFQCTQIFRYPHEKKSGDLGYPVIIFFPSVAREVLIQPFAGDILIYLIVKKDVCVEALIYINFSKCTLTEPKHPIRVIFSQLVQWLYQLFLFNRRQMLVLATSFSLCVPRSDVQVHTADCPKDR